MRQESFTGRSQRFYSLGNTFDRSEFVDPQLCHSPRNSPPDQIAYRVRDPHTATRLEPKSSKHQTNLIPFSDTSPPTAPRHSGDAVWAPRNSTSGAHAGTMQKLHNSAPPRQTAFPNAFNSKILSCIQSPTQLAILAAQLGWSPDPRFTKQTQSHFRTFLRRSQPVPREAPSRRLRACIPTAKCTTLFD
jgi:hypothetical protein